MTRIAHLARIEISDAEAEATLAQLNDIFGMIERMSRVDTEGVEPMSHPQGGVQRLREDRVTEVDRRADTMKNAPEQQDGLFLVPKVIGRRHVSRNPSPNCRARSSAVEISAVELAQLYLARIEAHRDINAFLDRAPG